MKTDMGHGRKMSELAQTTASVFADNSDDWDAKARWAASVFAKHRYRGHKIWVVEIKSIEMFFSEDAGGFESDILAHAWKADEGKQITVHGGFGYSTSFTAAEAYEIARTLEANGNPD